MDEHRNLSEEFCRDFNILKTNVQNDIDELERNGELTSENRCEIYEFHHQVFREKMFVKMKANTFKHVEDEYLVRVLYELKMFSDDIRKSRNKFQKDGDYTDAQMIDIDSSNLMFSDIRKYTEWERKVASPEELLEIDKENKEYLNSFKHTIIEKSDLQPNFTYEEYVLKFCVNQNDN